MVFNPDRVNIHELTIEDPEVQSDLPFDVERDITPEDWDGINLIIEAERNKEGGGIRSLLNVMAKIKIIDPGYNVDLNQKEREKLLKAARDDKKERSWSMLSGCAADLKISGSDLDLGIDENIWQEFNNCLKRDMNTGNYVALPAMAIEMKVIDPNVVLDFDQDAWSGMKSRLDEFRDTEQWFDFSYQAARMKIIDPNRKLDLDQKSWRGMLEKLNQTRRVEYARFIYMASYMKILAAEEVHIPPGGGLEIRMRKDKLAEVGIPPLPETKQF